MKNSAQRIRTSHVGRLPVPPGFEETALRLARGEVGGEEVAAQVVPVVTDVVKRQVAIGLDCIGDGEYWSALDIRWFDRQMTGLGTRPLKPGEVGSMLRRFRHLAQPGEPALVGFRPTLRQHIQPTTLVGREPVGQPALDLAARLIAGLDAEPLERAGRWDDDPAPPALLHHQPGKTAGRDNRLARRWATSA